MAPRWFGPHLGLSVSSCETAQLAFGSSSGIELRSISSSLFRKRPSEDIADLTGDFPVDFRARLNIRWAPSDTRVAAPGAPPRLTQRLSGRPAAPSMRYCRPTGGRARSPSSVIRRRFPDRRFLNNRISKTELP